MKSNQIFRTLAIAVILALMTIAKPVTPALAGTVTVSPASGPVATTIAISGTNFIGTTYQITFGYGTAFSQIIGGGTVVGGAITPTSFVIPKIPGGEYTIRIQTFGDENETRIATFTLTPEITLDKSSGFVGDEVIVDGNGFAASSSTTIYFGTKDVATTTTNANGEFADTAFIVPEGYNGSHTVEAQDAAGNSVTASFSTRQSIAITPITGASGTVATVSGTGFRAKNPITVTFDVLAVTTTPPLVTTNDYGSFTATLPVPVIVNGTYKVNATDGTNKASTDFTVLAGTSISPTTTEASPGHVGMELNVTGTGFTVGVKVIITYGDKEVATAIVESNGTFSATFGVPPSKHGTHTIVAADPINPANTRQFTFIMESDPPPIPASALPEEGIKTEAQAHFDWEGVSDPSGVTYTLQVASDDRFTEPSIVLKKDGLTESEYTLTEEERLESVKKETPYYWRVKTIDGAANESSWSTPGSFYVGFQWLELKGWLLYTLIGIGIILALFLGFWLGRRTSY